MYLDYALKVSTDIFVSMKLHKCHYISFLILNWCEFTTSELLNFIICDNNISRHVFILLYLNYKVLKINHKFIYTGRHGK